MDLLAGLLILIFLIPLVTAHSAKQYGRSFVWWFIIGCFLPVFSLLLLAVLPDLSENKKNNATS